VAKSTPSRTSLIVFYLDLILAHFALGKSSLMRPVPTDGRALVRYRRALSLHPQLRQSLALALSHHRAADRRPGYAAAERAKTIDMKLRYAAALALVG
jgi:hypothetical protein